MILQRCLVWSGPQGRSPRGSDGWRSIAYDISTAGIGLTLPLPVQPGTLLEIEGWGIPSSRPLRARVVRTAPVEFLWFCGCEFLEPLDEAELSAWLVKSRRALTLPPSQSVSEDASH
jgi:hypothetical protein